MRMAAGKLRVFALVGLIGALLGSPFLIAVVKNNLRASRMATHLASTALPSGAIVVDSTSRVFNGGNGDGCDYQGLVILSYWGDASELRQAYTKSLEQYAERFSDPRIISGETDEKEEWWAKIWSESTEFHMLPNSDFSGLHLISLTNRARNVSLDPRCW
ncbi:MAG: hypothetical protein NTX73_13130 [Rhodobacterales bacterium]|nr:hypothetical protein [Rhodobacterales bacterium]